MGKDRPWRTLVRFEGYEGENVRLVIPGWDWSTPVLIDKKEVPQAIHDRFVQGHIRCHAWMNIDTEKAESLCFLDWEEE